MKIDDSIIIKTVAEYSFQNDEKTAFFYDSKILSHRLTLLKNNYPKDTIHAIAIKTCDYKPVLETIIKKGFALEAASIEEVEKAVNAGAAASNIVFDSPVKTKEEIELCHTKYKGIRMNANSIEELERYPSSFNGLVGLRINPLVTNDADPLFNISLLDSKFGVPISKLDDILSACMKHSQIKCLHFHVSSGLKNYKAKLEAAKKIVELARTINAQRSARNISSKIECIDIGGGIEYNSENNYSQLKEFCDKLSEIEGIEDFQLVTEYGKFIHKDAAYVVSRIEYIVENSPQLPKIAFIHIGADLFVRKVYSILKINYPWLIIRNKQTSNSKKYNYKIVGPLCFAGDILYEKITTEEFSAGDLFVMKEVGANTISMWSKHCSRKKPRIILL